MTPQPPFSKKIVIVTVLVWTGSGFSIAGHRLLASLVYGVISCKAGENGEHCQGIVPFVKSDGVDMKSRLKIVKGVMVPRTVVDFIIQGIELIFKEPFDGSKFTFWQDGRSAEWLIMPRDYTSLLSVPSERRRSNAGILKGNN